MTPGKITIIIDNITNPGGTERAVSSLCNGLLSFYPESYRITILSLFSTGNLPPFFALDAKVHLEHLAEENDFKWWNKLLWYKKLVARLRQINQANPADLLLGTTYVHNILLPLIAKGSQTKTMGCEHVVYDYPPKPIQWIRKWVYPKLDSVVVLNPTEQSHFWFLKNTAVIPNCLPFENNEVAALENKSIITVGRLTHEKGVDMLIDIYKTICSQAPDWKFYIYGEGEDFEMINTKINENHLENHIALCGRSKNISESYLQSSIFVLGSRSESFGIVIIEAMNHGLPVISFDADGPKSLIKNGENGYLIPQFDRAVFSEKLLHLIKDESKRKAMGARALVTSLDYKEEKIIPLWNQQIQLLLGRRPN